jgi:soluble lytic murein transglycosylase-like protein
MRGIASPFSRLPTVAAWLAGAAILAGALSPKALAQGDETAMAVPRLAPFDDSGVALPQPLAAPDAAVLRRLFAQKTLNLPDLLREAARLDPAVQLNDEMLGHVLADRYLGGGAGRKPSAAELGAWLTHYAALPDAAAIAARLRQADPASRTVPAAAVKLPDAAERPGAWAGLTASMRHAARARTLFTHNRDAEALAEARLGAGRLGQADYIAGLAAWRLGKPAQALNHFAAAVAAPAADPDLRAAAAYWASRASVATGDGMRWQGWLTYAEAQRGTFYGMIAARAMGRTGGLAFADAVLGEADIAAVAAQPGGQRAFALLQLGQPARAEAELRQLTANDAGRGNLARAVILVADRAGLLDLAADLAAQGHADGPRVAVPRLAPRNGFLMDPALVYALARIESNFDPRAVSDEGAEGIMQLMPHTAGAMAHGRARLRDAAVNLDLGQRYVAYLAADGAVAGDLIRLLACYNAGPGAFTRWSGAIRDFDDPLLFIEAIPTDETRRFVQQALAFTWTYAERLGLPTPSLDALAAGKFPRFSPEAGGIRQAVLH